MKNSGLKDRVHLLLEIAREPLEIERIVQTIAPTNDADVRSAILELVIEGKAKAGQDGVALAIASAGEGRPGPEPEQNTQSDVWQESDSELEISSEIEFGRHGKTPAADSEEPGELVSRKSEEELPAWPWPELADEPFVEEGASRGMATLRGEVELEGLPAWPWSEFADEPADEDVPKDSQEAQVDKWKNPSPEEQSDEDTHYKKSPLFHDDSVDLLPMPKNSASKLRAIGVETIRDLLDAMRTPRFAALSRHVQLRAIQALRESCVPLRYTCEPRQSGELHLVSGSDEFLFDIFGVLVKLPDSAKAKAEGSAVDAASVNHDEAGGLSRVIQDPVLIRRLRVGGIVTLEDLLSKTDEDLLSIRGFGLTKLEKVREALESVNLDDLVNPSILESDDEDVICHAREECSGEAMALILAALDELDPDAWVFWPESFILSMAPLAAEVLASNPADPCAAFIDAFWAIGGMRQACRLAIPVLFDRFVDKFDSPLEAKGLLPDANWKPIVDECVAEGIWDYDSETCAVTKRFPTLQEWLDTLDGRNKDLLEMRFTGSTLGEVGEACGLTRERVRQLQTRLLECKPALREDEYLHIVDSYSISAKDFAEMTGLDERAYKYLDIVAPHPKSDRKAASEMLQDEAVPEHVKQAFSHTRTDALGSIPALSLTYAHEERFGSGASAVQANNAQGAAEDRAGGQHTRNNGLTTDNSETVDQNKQTAESLAANELAELLNEFDSLIASEANEDPALSFLIEQHVNQLGRIPVARLMAVLRQQNDIELTAVQLRVAIKEANVSFDEVRDFVSPLGGSLCV